MRTVHRLLATGLLSLAALTAAASSRADEIRVIASNAVKEAIAELTPAFEQRTGHRVAVAWSGTTDIARRVESGEAFDIAIIPGPVVYGLVQHPRRDFWRALRLLARHRRRRQRATPGRGQCLYAHCQSGGRPPHTWLDDGRSLFDLFHREWTLLAFGPDTPITAAFEDAASARALDLRVMRLPQPSLRALYEAPLVLIRPDQIVAWRGTSAERAADVLDRVTGR